MNGKVVVMGMVIGVVGLMAAAFLWPEGKEDTSAPAVSDEVEDDEEDTPEQNFRISERGKDGSVTITNLPEGAEDPVAAAKRRQAERLAARGEDALGNPFEGFVDDGSPLTQSAMEQPTMAEMDPTSADYDATVEARQRFHGYELDLLSSLPLTPDGWKEVTRGHQDDIKGVFKRSKELVDAGENEAARVLIEEWSELQNKYKAQAYGRSPQPYTDQ